MPYGYENTWPFNDYMGAQAAGVKKQKTQAAEKEPAKAPQATDEESLIFCECPKGCVNRCNPGMTTCSICVDECCCECIGCDRVEHVANCELRAGGSCTCGEEVAIAGLRVYAKRKYCEAFSSGLHCRSLGML